MAVAKPHGRDRPDCRIPDPVEPVEYMLARRSSVAAHRRGGTRPGDRRRGLRNRLQQNRLRRAIGARSLNAAVDFADQPAAQSLLVSSSGALASGTAIGCWWSFSAQKLDHVFEVGASSNIRS